MKRPPKTLKIGGLVYEILVLQEVKGQKGEDLWGQHDPIENKIRLRAGMSREREVEVLLHEILHGIWDQYGLPQKGEEKCVNQIGRGLLAILKDNPKLVKYLTGALK